MSSDVRCQTVAGQVLSGGSVHCCDSCNHVRGVKVKSTVKVSHSPDDLVQPATQKTQIANNSLRVIEYILVNRIKETFYIYVLHV